MRKIALFVAVFMPLYTTAMVVTFAMSDMIFNRNQQWFLGMTYFCGYLISIMAVLKLYQK